MRESLRRVSEPLTTSPLAASPEAGTLSAAAVPSVGFPVRSSYACVCAAASAAALPEKKVVGTTVPSPLTTTDLVESAMAGTMPLPAHQGRHAGPRGADQRVIASFLASTARMRLWATAEIRPFLCQGKNGRAGILFVPSWWKRA